MSKANNNKLVNNKLVENKPIGWGMLKESLPEMIGYVLFIGFLIWIKPPIYITAGIVTIYILVKMLLAKRFGWLRFLKACIVVYVFLGIIYSIYYFIGGTWALILAHIFGVTAIVIGKWRFIKKCDAQIKQQLDVIIAKGKVK